MKFTDVMIRNLKSEKKMYLREANGFTIRVMPSGAKTWLFIYTFEGNRKEFNLGSYPGVSLAEARTKHRDAAKLLSKDQDPAAVAFVAKEERRKAPAVADLVKEYIDKHAKKFKRSWQDDERLLNKEVVPVWGKRKAEDINKRDVTLLLENILDRGAPAMSNQVLKITRKMFNFAVERDIIQHTPFTGVKALAPSTSRERTLTETEVKTFWGSINNAAMSDEMKRALKLVLVTAQRPVEVSGMHSSEINGHWWVIPASRTKNAREHRVYLTDAALALIGNLTTTDEETGEEVPKGFIFPSPHKKKKQPIDSHALPVAVRRNLAWPLTDKKGKQLYDKDGKPATENKLQVGQFTPHDLRRTASTFMASIGFMDEIIDAVLNHVKKGIIRTYNRHGYDKEKQAALEAWGCMLESITTDRAAGKVIPIQRRIGE